MDLRDMLIRHEGLKLKPYLDCCGKFWRDCQCEEKGALTVGVGRNLDANGITYREAMAMLDNDIDRTLNDCLHAFPWFADLTDARQTVILNMCFNMGLTRLLKFKRMIAALERANYGLAAVEMMDSEWARQVGSRALELAMLMRGEAT